MKKLMITAAAALCAAVGFSDGITSANVVGYNNKGEFTTGAANMATPCFSKVTGDAVTLADLKMGGYEGHEVENGLTITMLNGNGVALQEVPSGMSSKKVRSYTWQDFPDAGIPAGWYDGDSQLLADEETCEEAGFDQSYWGDAKDITFTTGEGFRVTPSEDGQTLLCSGAVEMNGVDVSGFTAGAANGAGNPLPTSVTLAQIAMGGYEGHEIENGLTITMLNGNGVALQEVPSGMSSKKVRSYTWQDFPDAGIPAGWYDGDSQLLADDETCEEAGFDQSYWGDAKDITFAAGDGFRVTPSDDGQTLQFPEIK